MIEKIKQVLKLQGEFGTHIYNWKAFVIITKGKYGENILDDYDYPLELIGFVDEMRFFCMLDREEYNEYKKATAPTVADEKL